jgi:UDP-N-acetylmuramoylalanine--D-glutamate ligase
MNIAIIGFGTEGRAAYDYYRNKGDSITVCDQNVSVELPDGAASQLGDDYLRDLDRFDVIVRSPFVRPDALVAANSVDILPKITSNTNEFMRVCPSRNIIGVTGTKGKGTTSSLITAMLRSAGYTVHLGGNIGVGALDLLKAGISPDDWVVLELSSFQLIDLQRSPHIAVCLMVAPEHLNWHEDMQEYLAAKQQLFRWQTTDDVAVYYPDNANTTAVVDAGEATKIPYMREPGALVRDDIITINDQAICETGELSLLGAHNWQNACAAVTAVWNITQDVDAIRDALTTFTGLEHRLELVRELDGVRYFDDSFGTTPETAIVAIEAFDEPKVVILGGSDKGASYDQLAATVAASSIRQVLLIGDQAARIQAALDGAGFSNYQPGGDTMAEIISRARAATKPGDVVLLSTGCASFGMFKDYKDRGNQFKQVVLGLVSVDGQ